MADSALVTEIQTVAIAVLLSMVAAIWITGGVSAFITFEKPTANAYVDVDVTSGYAKVTLTVSNGGTKTMTIESITVTGNRDLRILGLNATVNGIEQAQSLPLRIPQGARATISITLAGAVRAETAEIRLTTAQGTELIQMVTL